MITDLTASRVCYLIIDELMNNNPDCLYYYNLTFREIVKIALFNLYNDVKETPKKDLNLISNPNKLGNFNVDILYCDDLTQPKKQNQNIINWEETQERHS